MTGATRSAAAAVTLVVTLLAGSVDGSAGAAQLPAAAPAAAPVAETYPVPPGGVFTLTGHGYGPGHGLSQWGAFGAARSGLSAHKIVAFYYPHTTLTAEEPSRLLRVLISAADAPADGYVEARPATGLRLTRVPSKQPLPTESPDSAFPITAYRLAAAAGALSLTERWNDHWHAVGDPLGTKVGFVDPASTVTLVEPVGDVTYRGSIVAEIHSAGVEPVNMVPVEDYLRGVVPAEMPSSFAPAALRAQAIAARTYAARALANPKAPWFDIYGDTRDQAYGGESHETAKTDAAAQATAGEVLVDASGAPVLAQYGAADGGWTTSGGLPYLPAQKDPYDGVVANQAHTWTTSRSATTVVAAYPQLGTLRDLVVTGRDGNGAWGGRVTTLDLVGSKTTVSVSGDAFQAALGLLSPWFRPTPTPGAPRKLKATVGKATGDAGSKTHSVEVDWKPPAAIAGAAAVTSYRVVFGPADGSATPTVLRVDATAASATIPTVTRGSYVVSVAALSTAGRGPAATIDITVGRS